MAIRGLACTPWCAAEDALSHRIASDMGCEWRDVNVIFDRTLSLVKGVRMDVVQSDTIIAESRSPGELFADLM